MRADAQDGRSKVHRVILIIAPSSFALYNYMRTNTDHRITSRSCTKVEKTWYLDMWYALIPEDLSFTL